MENKEKMENMENMEDMEPEYITLSDDNGVEREFEVIDSIESGVATYLALVPTDEAEEDEGSVFIFKVVVEGDVEYIEPIEDDEEYEAVSEAFIDRLEEYYDFKIGTES